MSQDPNDPNNSVNSAVPGPQQVGQQMPPVQTGYYYIDPNPRVLTFTYSGNTWVTNVAAPAPEGEEAIEMEADEGKGCTCKKCNNFNEYAEPNQEDGTFVCYACRRGW